jgi:hypothetical protein
LQKLVKKTEGILGVKLQTQRGTKVTTSVIFKAREETIYLYIVDAYILRSILEKLNQIK